METTFDPMTQDNFRPQADQKADRAGSIGAWRKTPPDAIDPVPRLDEQTIQDLLDASIREGSGAPLNEPLNLDTSLSGNWRISGR